MRDTILICGAYGLGNAGDEAILTAILDEVRRTAPGYRTAVLSRDPRETAAQYGVDALWMFDLPGIWRILGRTALYINGGGTLIQDATSRRSLWYYLWTLWAARERGCRVLMHGCGIGPVSDRRDRLLTRRILSRCVDAVTLRDPDSLGELRSLGVEGPDVVLSADPALALSPAPPEEVDRILSRAGIAPGGRYICFALREWKGWERAVPAFREAARWSREVHGLTPVFMSIEKRQDPAAGRLAAEGLEDVRFLDDPGGPGAIIGALSRMDVVVAMRLHALIFAAGQGVPLVGVVYDPKVPAFLRYLGQELFAELDGLDARTLEELIGRALEKGPEEQAAAVERLRSIEARNAETAARLLGTGP